MAISASVRRSFLIVTYFLVPTVAAISPGHAQVLYPNKEARIPNLPALTAKSEEANEVLATAVAIILRDWEVCCGKRSAMGYDVHAADARSLKDIASKLQGRHVMGDGRAVMVTAEYMPLSSVNSGQLIAAIRSSRRCSCSGMDSFT